MFQHLTIEHAIQIGSGLLMLGVSWGVMKTSVNGLEKRLDMHITETRSWRESMDDRITSLTEALLGRK